MNNNLVVQKVSSGRKVYAVDDMRSLQVWLEVLLEKYKGQALARVSRRRMEDMLDVIMEENEKGAK